MDRVFFDTSICIDAAKERKGINRRDWQKVARFVTSHYRYFISPLTLGELVAGLRNSSEETFIADLEPIRIVACGKSPKFLPYPKQFVADRLFGASLPLKDGISENFSYWLTSSLHSRSKAELSTKMNLDQFSTEIQSIENQFAINCEIDRHDMLNSVKLADFDRRWAGGFLEILRLPVNDRNCETMINGVNAAYFMERNLRETAANRNFQKNRSELVDAQQLAYMCDPTMHMVSTDSRLRSWISRSPQSARVLSYEQFLNLALSS
jgi:hypothetical protein